MNRTLLTWIVLAVVWLPFLLLSLFNVPIGMHEWEWMTDNAGRLPASFLEKQVFIYTEIMGRYTSNAVLSLTSLWCTPANFPYFFLVWHLLWFGCCWWMFRAVIPGQSLQLVSWLAVCVQVLYLTSLHDVYDSMYRYTGIITYQFGAMLSMLAIGFLAKHHHSQRTTSLYGGLTVLALVLSIGTNEITMVITGWVAALWFVFNHRTLKSKSMVVTVLAVMMCCCLAVILTPANAARQAGEGDSLGLMQGIGLTIGTTAFIWFDWLSTTMLIPLMILSFPMLVRHAGLFAGYQVFNNPKFWILVLAGIVPLSMALTVFGTGGNAFPERVIDHMFVYVILAGLGLLITWSVRCQPAVEKLLLQHNVIVQYMVVALSVFVVLHMFGKGLQVNRDKAFAGHAVDRIEVTSTPTDAWLTILRGEAASYHAQASVALETLKACASDTCYMIKPDVLPVQLYDPLSDRRNRHGDAYMGYYYNPNIKLVRYSPE